jgi:ABC-type lipoprotein export system ATPase subunit
VVRCEQLSRVFRRRDGTVEALRAVDLEVASGQFVVVRGPSGSGKTTLLLALGGMLRPSAGRVLINGQDVYAMSRPERARFRATHIGFVFQMFHLVPYLNLLDNVRLAGGVTGAAELGRAGALLDRLGLTPRQRHRPAELSAGERQRTAIARALLNGPRLVLADEPTGNLDPDNAAEVYDALAGFHRDGGTVIIVTHGAGADRYADRIVHLRDGRIEERAAGATAKTS